MFKISRSLALVAAVAASSLAAAQAQAVVVYGLNATGTTVFTFDTAAPGTIQSGSAISGLAANEQLTSIDIRPATNALYGVGTFGNVYTINPITGAAASVGDLGSPNGVNFGMDFNPTVDLIRFVSDADTNLRLSPANGAATLDTNLAFAAGDPNVGTNPNVVAVGYTNNFAGSTTTTLYALDSGLNTLLSFSNPNGGLLTTVGPLGVDFTSVAGLDIVGANNTAYAVIQPVNDNRSFLYTVNLATGLGTNLGQIGGGFEVRDIAVVIPEPTSLALFGLAVPALLARRRKA